MRLHVRAPLGTKLEETERLVERVERAVRETIGSGELETMNATIGLPSYFNLAFIQTDNMGPQDAEMLIALKPGHGPTETWRRSLRSLLPERFPEATFYFQSPDLISQVLDFGASSPIDVRIEGRKLAETQELARAVADRIRRVPGVVDVRVAQPASHPALRVEVDRERAGAVGVSQRSAATTLLTALSSSGMVAPSYWIDPATNQSYLVSVQAPAAALHDVDDVRALPVPTAARDATVPLAGVGTVALARANAMITHENVQRVVDVQCDTDGRDLASTAADVERTVATLGPMPKGVRLSVTGRIETLSSAFRSLRLGLVVAALLAYLLMVVLFQSWSDPLLVMVAVPGALGGVVVALALTGTTFNVESLMGAILAVGLATANSILLVSFANELVKHGRAPIDAAIEAAGTRLRPVLMTAGAMLFGMLPMAVGFGEAGEQNAPLGRAVIGGLIGATATTLWIVPLVYARVRGRREPEHDAE
jgi:multidrug efflux pump subunit AcrB